MPKPNLGSEVCHSWHIPPEYLKNQFSNFEDGDQLIIGKYARTWREQIQVTVL